MKKTISISLYHTVRVVLSEAGAIAYPVHRGKLTKVGDYIGFQFWELINEFGLHIAQGKPTCFQLIEIEFDADLDAPAPPEPVPEQTSPWAAELARIDDAKEALVERAAMSDTPEAREYRAALAAFVDTVRKS